MKKKRFAKFIVIFTLLTGIGLISYGGYLLLRDYYLNPEKKIMEQENPEEESQKFSLPFHTSNLVDPIQNFGICPYGLKNEVYPEGNQGLDFELYKGTEVLSVNTGEILEIKENRQIPGTYNIFIKYEQANVLYAEILNPASELKKGGKISKETILGETGHILSEEVTLLHIEVYKESKIVCPFSCFSEDAKKEIQLLLSRSLNQETKKPFESVCIKNN